ncbi:PGK1, partial [Symbiodinium necroappetens]
LHLLARFPQLRYFGADPTIKDEVREAYSPYAARAELHATTSEEMHQALADAEPMDIVFVDGPHTYANVRNDLHLWESRVKKGGIIAGHDFTV